MWEQVTHLERGEVQGIEIIPISGEHEEGMGCWCDPWRAMLCRECEHLSSEEREREGCWRCGGEGWVDYEEWSGEVPLVSHNDPRFP